MSFKSVGVQSPQSAKAKKFPNNDNIGSKYLSGLLFMTISAAAFGSAPTFAKIAFDNSINAISLQSYRFLITFTIIVLVLLVSAQRWGVNQSHIPRLFLLALSTGLSSFCYMTSVRYIPVAVASLTFFTFPLIVAPASHILKLDRLNGLKIAAMFAAFGGLCLLLGDSYLLDWLGILMAFAAGLCVATSFIVAKPLTQDLSPLTLATISTGIPCIVYLFITFSLTQFVTPNNLPGVFGVAGNSLCHAIGLTCCYAAIARLGALRTAVFMNIEPLISVLVAYLLLGQTITTIQMLGVFGVMFGIVLISYNRVP